MIMRIFFEISNAENIETSASTSVKEKFLVVMQVFFIVKKFCRDKPSLSQKIIPKNVRSKIDYYCRIPIKILIIFSTILFLYIF